MSIPGNSVDLDKLRDELTQKLDVIRELQRELVRKDSRLQTEKLKTKQLIEERSDEQRRYEAALKGKEKAFVVCTNMYSVYWDDF